MTEMAERSLGPAFPDAMPWQNAANINDDDLAALSAYLTAPIK
jgi:hypothetical protein